VFVRERRVPSSIHFETGEEMGKFSQMAASGEEGEASFCRRKAEDFRGALVLLVAVLTGKGFSRK